MNTTRCNPIIRFYPNHWTRPLTFQWRNFGVGRNVVRSTSSLHEQIVPLRKELKEEAKRRRIESKIAPAHSKDDVKLANWELTVGIEIHAELNTSRKLFSDAFTSTSGEPNSNIALFDLAYPGSQPHFQAATLIPALRAALALNCKIERKSSFDRKHYFYQDQPAGYQITQYYEPFARDGRIILYDHDGIAPEDGKSVTIGVKQIQMEQDTAKTLHEPSSSHILDFNRVSHPLIEIITLPHIHHPSTAAACVRKIQSTLKSVNSCVAGMEVGGLRADVNVSVRRRNDAGIETGSHSYYGVSGLGQRTEIKNLNSFKAVEDAIIAERDRQIKVLESGGVVEGETRGWSLGSIETRKLRGKEGEVDYRYMPDPDLGPVIISSELVDRLRQTLPALADDTLATLTDSSKYMLTVKDAKTLLTLDNTERLDYYLDVVENLHSLSPDLPKDIGRIAGNWVLHEIGGLFSKADVPWCADRVPSTSLARIIWYLVSTKINGRSAKQLLELIYNNDPRDIDTIVQEQDMILKQISEDTYFNLARRLVTENPKMVQAIKQKGQKGKIMWFVGQMIRELGQGAQAEQAKRVLHQILDIPDDSKRK